MDNKRTMLNDAAMIEQRILEVNQLSCFAASAMGFPKLISTVRGGMMTRHNSQRVVLTNPEFPMLFTGAENPFGQRSSWNVKATDDYKIMKIFKKFKDNPNSPILYIFKNIKTGKYKSELIRPAVNLTEKYGFRMNNALKNYSEGDTVKKGTIITQSSSYVNDHYCAGRNVRLMYAVLPELTEDAIVIDESLADDLSYDMVDIVTVNVNKNAFLLNKYGDANLYKPFPDIGEEIRNDLICSVRENSFLSTKIEANVPHIGDTGYYTNGGGTIVDIDIFTNMEMEDQQFNYYQSQIKDWYSEISTYISTIMGDISQDDTSLIDIQHKAEKCLNGSVWVTKEYVADTIIEFTVLQNKKIRIGQKMVGRYGNKSVVSGIVPSEHMPKTDDGRPIQMLANALAIPNRIISFALYESTITFMQERMYQHFMTLSDKEKSTKGVRMIYEFLDLFNHQQAGEFSRLIKDDVNAVVADIVKNGIFVNLPPNNNIIIRDSIIKAYELWPDIMKYYDIDVKLRNRRIKLDQPYPVGYQYTWILKQEPSKSMSTRSTGRTTLYDLPVKTRSYNDNRRIYSDNPIKFGEYDSYNFLAGVPIKKFSRISTYFRGAQYEENSVLMSHLNNVGIDTTKYNKFPQLDNLKNMLKLLGVKLKQDPFNYNTIGNRFDKYDVMFNNVSVNISIPDLRHVLIIHSYYLQWQEHMQGIGNMQEFFGKMRETNVFEGMMKDEIDHVLNMFNELLPTLQQIKQYE